MNTKENIEKEIEKRLIENKERLESRTSTKNGIVSTKDFTESHLTMLKTLLQNKTTAALSAAKQNKSSASTIVMTQEELEEFSALDATLTTNGSWRIHAQFNHIGAWTHRMSHNSPNVANIATEKSIKFKSDTLSKLALHYGKEMRSLWTRDLDEECYLVGTDAEGIQLRIFAHYINDPKFIFAVTQGKKEDGTDPHSLNKQALGHICKSRDNAKTLKRLDVYKSIELRGTPRHLGQS